MAKYKNRNKIMRDALTLKLEDALLGTNDALASVLQEVIDELELTPNEQIYLGALMIRVNVKEDKSAKQLRRHKKTSRRQTASLVR